MQQPKNVPIVTVILCALLANPAVRADESIQQSEGSELTSKESTKRQDQSDTNSSGGGCQPYRLMANNDGNGLWTDPPITVEKLVQRTMGHLLDTQVDAITWTLGTDIWRQPNQQMAGRATNLYSHQTEVGERFYELKPPFQSWAWRNYAQQLKQFIREGHDPPAVIVEQGHRHGLDVFIGLRMNDAHDGRIAERDNRHLTYPEITMARPVFKDGRIIEKNIRGYVSRMKIEHPELLIGVHPELTRLTTLCFDFKHQRVRDSKLALIEEAIQKYDADGVDLDFLRHPLYFQPGEERANLHLMTDLISKIRKALDEAGKDRGRRLKLCVRVLAPLEACEAIGLDVRTWLENRWIDVLIAGVVERVQLDLDGMVRVAHANDCWVYASIKVDRYRSDPKVLRGIAANHYRAGIDGMYLFNFYHNRESSMKQEIGSWEKIRFMDKVYVLNSLGHGHKSGSHNMLELSLDMRKRIQRSELGTTLNQPKLPCRLLQGQSAEILLPIADDYREASQHGLNMTARLNIRVRDLTGGTHILGLDINGKPVTKQKFTRDRKFAIDVEPTALNAGENLVKLSLENADRTVLSEVLVDNLSLEVGYQPR